MRIIILSFNLLLLSGSCFGQLKNYNVSEFLYPDISRTTFTITPKVNFDNFNNSGNEGRRVLNLNTGVFRSRILNSRKKQSLNSFFINSGYDAHKVEEENSQRFYGVLEFNLENRYFFKERRFFEIKLRSQNTLNERSSTVVLEDSQNEFSTFNFISPKIGWGRLENITDGWHAWSILKILEDSGKLQRALTPEEIDQFGFEISKIMNLRNRDFRLENIAEFQTLVEYVVENGIIDANDYGAIALLKDGFEFEDFTNRSQGRSFKIGPEIRFSSSNFNVAEMGFLFNNNFSIQAEYENRKAIKNIFQFDQRYTVRGGQLHIKNASSENFNTSNFLEVGSSINFGYYLNQRTNLSIGHFAHFAAFEDSISRFFSTGINLGATYYVSPRLRYNLSSRINLLRFNAGIEDLSTQNNSFLNMGIEYFVR